MKSGSLTEQKCANAIKQTDLVIFNNDCWLHVLNFLNAEEAKLFGLVCRMFHQLIEYLEQAKKIMVAPREKVIWIAFKVGGLSGLLGRIPSKITDFFCMPETGVTVVLSNNQLWQCNLHSKPVKLVNLYDYLTDIANYLLQHHNNQISPAERDILRITTAGFSIKTKKLFFNIATSEIQVGATFGFTDDDPNVLNCPDWTHYKELVIISFKKAQRQTWIFKSVKFGDLIHTQKRSGNFKVSFNASTNFFFNHVFIGKLARQINRARPQICSNMSLLQLLRKDEESACVEVRSHFERTVMCYRNTIFYPKYQSSQVLNVHARMKLIQAFTILKKNKFHIFTDQPGGFYVLAEKIFAENNEVLVCCHKLIKISQAAIASLQKTRPVLLTLLSYLPTFDDSIKQLIQFKQQVEVVNRQMQQWMPVTLLPS